MTAVSAITFDFNGTLSNDEPILCKIFRALFHDAAGSEWAQTVEDVVRRRTTLALRGCAGADVTKRVEELVGLERGCVTSGA